MRLSDPWPVIAGTFGIVAANLLLVSVRTFAWRTGLQVEWLSRSYARERNHLRNLASSGEDRIARKARSYLRLEILAWLVLVVSICGLFWGVMHAQTPARHGGGEHPNTLGRPL
jgi:hypothetical protein